MRGLGFKLGGLFGVFLMSVTGQALADGIPIPEVVGSAESDTVTVGTQRAVLWLRPDAVELHIEPKFTWKHKGAAWVIPLPARPEVMIGDSGFMDDLDNFTKPRFFYLISESECCYGEDCPLGKGDVNLKGSSEEVVIWDSGSLGNLDYTILSAKEGASIEKWLSEHGYNIGSEKVKEKLETMETSETWFFAARLSKSPKKGQSIGAIRFIFPPDTWPFYPLALTASGLAENDHFDVLLWVIDSRPEHKVVPVPSRFEVIDYLNTTSTYPEALRDNYNATLEVKLNNPHHPINIVLEAGGEVDSYENFLWEGILLMDSPYIEGELPVFSPTSPLSKEALKEGNYIARYRMRVFPSLKNDVEWKYEPGWKGVQC